MSTALTDALIELSEPENLSRFHADPEPFLARWGLTEGDANALVTGDRIGLRVRARSVDDGDPIQQFNRHGNTQLIEIDPVVHLDLQANDNIAATGPGMLFVNEEGTVLRAEVV